MRLVIDTNVVAYYLLRTEPFYDEVRELWHRLEQPVAPASWLAEFANAVWVVTRAGALSTADAFDRLRLANQLNIETVDLGSLWTGALSRALTSNHSVYDTLFVELAIREGVSLATCDKKLLAVFRTSSPLPPSANSG